MIVEKTQIESILKNSIAVAVNSDNVDLKSLNKVSVLIGLIMYCRDNIFISKFIEKAPKMHIYVLEILDYFMM